MTEVSSHLFRRCCWAAFCLLFVALGPRLAQAIVSEAGSFVTKAEELRDLTFARDSNLYVPPTAAERDDFAWLAATLLAGDLVSAEMQAAAQDYDLVEFYDTDTENTYIGLVEQLDGGNPTRGWGSYFVNPSALTSPLIQVPHPRFDTNSWEIGARAFQQSEALGFLMAGAHRNANGQGTADVAHLSESIFQEVHETWNGAAGENQPWSIHGFNDANHSFPAGTDAVLSNGDGSVSPAAVALDAEFEAEGFLTFAYNTLPVTDPLNVAVNGTEDGTTFSSLGGTTNVQGIHSRGIGGEFLHVEMEQSIRFDAGNRLLAAEAIADAIISTSTIPESACNDDYDNDGDGLVDLNDLGCADANDLDERDLLLPCDDGADNDADGGIDFDPVTAADPTGEAGIGDPGCRNPSSKQENPNCQDGVNNDGALGTDFDGGESILGVGNGDPDGADPQCAGKPWRNSEARRSPCGLGTELALLMPLLAWVRRRARA